MATTTPVTDFTLLQGPTVKSALLNAAANSGILFPASPNQFDEITNVEAILYTLLYQPVTDALIAAGASSLNTRVTTIVGPAASTYAITLAAPPTGVAGLLKEITMISTTSTNAVTLALTNVVGGSQATTATFDAAGETLMLVSNAVGKWVVFKEYGVTLS